MKSSLYISAVVAFVVVFGAGALSGSLLVKRSTVEAQRKPPCTKSMSQRMIAYLTEELQLTDRQVMEIKPFVESTCNDLGAIHKEALGHASEAIEECHMTIIPFLSEAQAAKLTVCESERQKFLTIECGYESLSDPECEH